MRSERNPRPVVHDVLGVFMPGQGGAPSKPRPVREFKVREKRGPGPRLARLLKRSLGLDADVCDACGARMTLRALVVRAESIARFLAKLGEPTEPPRLSPARGPPYFESRALRRKLGELGGQPAQVEMFGA
jgi:hypothetical protein